MEKYSQFRDKGTGIAPFLPIPTSPSGIYLPFHVFLFALRLPILLTAIFVYFAIFSWLPLGSLVKKAALWPILGVPGLWWVDLQIDGVKKGSLTKQTSLSRLPQPGGVLVSSSTSPIDTLYLAAIFDPVFTISYPHTRLVQPASLLQSILAAFQTPSTEPNTKHGKPTLCTLAELSRAHPDRIICVLAECTTTNGRGILPLSPSVLSATPGCKIFPVSLRYTPADITTAVPGWSEALRFFWNLCSKPTHTIRVRVAEAIPNVASTRSSNDEDDHNMEIYTSRGSLSEEEDRVLDRVAESLARLGRVKRVAVGVSDKIEFIRVWSKRRR